VDFPSENGAVAQLGERVVRNDEVVGSIPISSIIFISSLEIRLFFRNPYLDIYVPLYNYFY
jgi:hypothetical protein